MTVYDQSYYSSRSLKPPEGHVHSPPHLHLHSPVLMCLEMSSHFNVHILPECGCRERVLEGNSVSAQLPYRERRSLGMTELEEI